ncbi:hypothetical protein BCUE_0075 [Candidatus Kinetoplastibacterium blastocrithidii TCC012E]|uniref:Uncharacterized protein n=1 Tax=Candidatus Kinetoplastidibacterium blastocrithidiae TCC012E TaxID=1208922 RepID=M1LCA2_9PROT|nr:hypothetical protein BCUE_0075 [Candidatus Kinetoplastibacterium blastocrithidii TCC012E]
MKERTLAIVSIFILFSLMILIFTNWISLYKNYTSKQCDIKTVEYWGNNFFVISINKNDETVKIINGESMNKTLSSSIVKINNPNIIINNKN